MPRVTEAEATAWLAVACQVSSQPCLDAEEIAHLVRGARRRDSDGRKPSDDNWKATYDLNWAAWKGWLLKASKAVLMVDVGGGGGLSVSKSQVRQACLETAREYARGVQQASDIAPDLDDALGSPGLGSPGTTFGPDGRILDDDFPDTEPAFRDGLPVV